MIINIFRRPWLDYIILTLAFFLMLHTFFEWPLIIAGLVDSQSLIATAGTGSVTRQLGAMILFVYGAFGWWQTRHTRLKSDTVLCVVATLLFLWVAASVLWSDTRAISATRWIGFAVSIFAAMASVKRLTVREIITWYAGSNWLYIIIGIALELRLGLFRPWADGYRFAGTEHPNATAMDSYLMLIASLALLSTGPRKKLYYIWATTAFTILLLTKSRTTLLCVLAGVILYQGILRLRKLALFLFLYLVATISFSAPYILGNLHDINQQLSTSLGRKDEGGDEDFDGRLPLWEYLLADIKQRPLIGHGFGGFWTQDRINIISDDLWWEISEGHSAYMECALALGVIGLGLYVILLFGTIFRNIQRDRKAVNPDAFFGAILIAVVINGTMSSEPWLAASILLFAIGQAVFIINFRIVHANLISTTERAALVSRELES